MPQLVDVQGVGIVEFPDEMSEDEITSALSKEFPAPKELEPDLSQVRLSPYEAAASKSMQASLGLPATGMEPGTGLTTALAAGIPEDIGAGAALIGRGALAVANLPTRLANIARGATVPEAPGYVPYLEELPRPQFPTLSPEEVPPGQTGLQALAGAGNLISQTAQELIPPFAAPEVGLTMPLLGGRNILGRLASGVYGAAALAQVPEEIRQAQAALATPEVPLMEKISKTGRVPITSGFGGLMMKHALAAKQAGLTKAAAELERQVIEDAAKERQVQEGVQAERAGGVQVGVPAEAGARDVVSPGAEVGGKLAQEGQAGVLLEFERGKPMPKEAAGKLDPEAVRYLEEERAAIDAPVDIEPTPATEGAGPFAAKESMNFMEADIANQRIKLRMPALIDWLTKDVPREKWKQAIKARLNEEWIHLKTIPADALKYYQSLSIPEKYFEQRIYLGKNWRQRLQAKEFDSTQIGFEAIRRRMQRLNRMTSSEAAETAGRERWTIGTLEVLNDVVRKVRELANTEASQAQRGIVNAMLDRMQNNLDAARVAVGGPAATRRDMTQEDRMDFARRLPEMTPEEFLKEGQAFNTINIPLGEEATPGQIAELQSLAKKAQARSDKVLQDFAETRRIITDPRTTAEQKAKATAESERLLPELGTTTMMPQFYNEALARTKPGATRRQREAEKATGEFYLPPVGRGEAVERAGFATPTPQVIRDIADVHFTDLTEPPSLERFKGEIESRFGSMRPEQLYDAWQDAMYKRLMSASGTQVEALMDKLNLRPEVAKALKPGEAEPRLGRGQIPDALEMPGTQMGLAEIDRFFKQRQWKTKAAFRQKFSQQQRTRYAAIGEIVNKLSEKAGKPPERPWSRKEIGPEEISHVAQVIRGAERRVDPDTGVESMTPAEIDSAPQWYSFRPEDLTDPNSLGLFAVRGARVKGEKVTISNNLMAVRGQDGKVYMLSVFNDPRTGPKVTNPEGANLSSRNIDKKFIAEYRPLVVTRLREPVERFRQVFENQEAFDKHFGDVAIEGTEGLRGSMFIGPEAAAARAQAGTTTGRGVTPEAPTPVLPEPEFVSPTSRELTAPGPRPPISGRTPLARYPEKFPPPARTEMLTPEEQKFVAEQARKEYPAPMPKVIYRQLAQRKVPKEPYRVGATRRISEEAELVAKDIKRMIQIWPTRNRIRATLDAVDNRKNNLALQKEMHVRLASEGTPGAIKGRGNLEVLAAANVLLESVYDPQRALWRNVAMRTGTQVGDFDPRAIPIFRREVERGRVRAEAHLTDPSPAKRRLGRAEMRVYDQLTRELDYAEAHWNDPVLQETAKRLKDTYAEQLAELRKRGIDAHEHPGFNPHRYEAAIWNGHSYLFNIASGVQKILGERTLAQRTFDSYYHAFGTDAYLPVTRDSASLLNHYIRKTGGLMYREEWREGLKAMRTSSGEEVAADPKTSGGKRLPHKLGYQIVDDGYSGLSVHPDFARLIRQLVSPSHVELHAVSRAALHLSQILKHSILVGDFFHLGRMVYYGLAVMGRKAGFKSGWSVLDIAERDMAEAVAKGVIRPEDVAWANTRVPLPRGRSMTRRQIAEKFYQEIGANLGRVQDALYKELVVNLTPTSGPIRRGVLRVLDPTVGRYNRFLFDRLTRGMMTEAVVREFERQMKANPKASPKLIMRDISKDVNNFFGNIGRQGWFKSKTSQDIARILFLAPQWVEGLIKKETVGPLRLTGIPKLTGMRQGPSTLGTTGMAMGRGMLFMFALTQALNLIFRRQPTWKNEEEGHRMDAWIPGWGDHQGFWFSPMALFNEVSHDLWRLWNSKPTFADAVSQIIGNKEQPITRAVLVGLTGQSPMGQKITTTGGRLKEMGKAVLPVPISFGRLAQAGLSKVAPGMVSPPPRGSVPRQFVASLGIKIEPAETAVQQVSDLARTWMERENLKPTTGWQEVQTDEPGYTKLRTAIRNQDWIASRRNFEALREHRSDKQILDSMKKWKDGGFTHADQKTEREFRASLTDREAEVYSQAEEEKQIQYEKFLDWYWQQP